MCPARRVFYENISVLQLIVIPSVDIIYGRVARLLRGDPKHILSYEHLTDPVTVAKIWESEGARLIHVVDLDAALGRGDNIEIVSRIIRSLNVPVQVGGGIRSIERAHQIISLGAKRIVIGSMAFKEPNTFRALLDEFGPEKIIVALDHLDGVVVVDGWREGTGVGLREAARRFTDMGVRFLLVTAVRRDGSLEGPDLENLSKILDLNVNIIASGGVRSLEDIMALKELGLYGVIVGRALYEGRISIRNL